MVLVGGVVDVLIEAVIVVVLEVVTDEKILSICSSIALLTAVEMASPIPSHDVSNMEDTRRNKVTRNNGVRLFLSI